MLIPQIFIAYILTTHSIDIPSIIYHRSHRIIYKIYIDLQIESKDKDQMQKECKQTTQCPSSEILDECSFNAIGMMSGTSQDGVDLSFSTYYYKQSKYLLLSSHTYSYPPTILHLIRELQTNTNSYYHFLQQEITYSQYIVDILRNFIEERIRNKFGAINIHFIGFHGHTIFHRPHQGITKQIGNINYISAHLQIDVIGNFRQLDVVRGGQGAPLAPYGEDIFEGDIFLNLGGIANIGYGGVNSSRSGGGVNSSRSGYDICFCNLFLNDYALKIANKSYDEDGQVGASGSLQKQLLEYMQQISYPMTSLSREQFQKYVAQIQLKYHYLDRKDVLHTYYHYLKNAIITQTILIASQIQTEKTKQNSKVNQSQENSKANQSHESESVKRIICTGGGAYNKYLMKLLKEEAIIKQLKVVFEVGEKQLVEFKEAILFGYLGVKFLKGISNCSKGVGGNLVKGSL